MDLEGIKMAQDKFLWWTLVNILINIWFLYGREIYSLGELLQASQFKNQDVNWIQFVQYILQCRDLDQLSDC
jgi:hypothetical protein